MMKDRRYAVVGGEDMVRFLYSVVVMALIMPGAMVYGCNAPAMAATPISVEASAARSMAELINANSNQEELADIQDLFGYTYCCPTATKPAKFCKSTKQSPAYKLCSRISFLDGECDVWTTITGMIRAWEPAIDEDGDHHKMVLSRGALLDSIVHTLADQDQYQQLFKTTIAELSSQSISLEKIVETDEFQLIALIIIQALMREKPYVIPFGKVQLLLSDIIRPQKEKAKMALMSTTDLSSQLLFSLYAALDIFVTTYQESLSNENNPDNQMAAILAEYAVCDKQPATITQGSLKYQMDWSHIFTIHKTPKKEIDGFHHDYMDLLSKFGIIQRSEEELGVAGINEYKVIYDGLCSYKTFFPAYYTQQKVKDIVAHALPATLDSAVSVAFGCGATTLPKIYKIQISELNSGIWLASFFQTTVQPDVFKVNTVYPMLSETARPPKKCSV